MPVPSSSSAAISAACHKSPEDPHDVALHPLKYGVFKQISKNGLQTTGFSSLEVTPLQHAKTYEGLPDFSDSEIKILRAYVAFQKLSLREQLSLLTAKLILQNDTPIRDQSSYDKEMSIEIRTVDESSERIIFRHLSAQRQLDIVTQNILYPLAERSPERIHSRQGLHLDVRNIASVINRNIRHRMPVREQIESVTVYLTQQLGTEPELLTAMVRHL